MNNYKILLCFVMTSLLSINTFSGHHEESAGTLIGDVEMTEKAHSEGFNEMKKMLGKWEGKLTQFTGTVIDVSSDFKLVSGGNLITESLGLALKTEPVDTVPARPRLARPRPGARASVLRARPRTPSVLWLRPRVRPVGLGLALRTEPPPRSSE